MSLENEIVELREAVVALTAAYQGTQAKAAPTGKTTRRAAKPSEEEEEEKKPAKKTTRRKPKKEPEPESSDDEVTEDDIRAIGTKIIKAGGAAEFREVLSEFDAAKTSELDEGDYAEVLEKLEAVLEAVDI